MILLIFHAILNLIFVVNITNSQDTSKYINYEKIIKPSEAWDQMDSTAIKSYLNGFKNFVSTRDYSRIKGYTPKKGIVPDEKTAIKIAEAVWLAIYGNSIYDTKPFIAMLIKKGKVWRVVGTLPPSYLGGTPFIEIRKRDGKVLKIFHEK